MGPERAVHNRERPFHDTETEAGFLQVSDSKIDSKIDSKTDLRSSFLGECLRVKNKATRHTLTAYVLRYNFEEYKIFAVKGEVSMSVNRKTRRDKVGRLIWNKRCAERTYILQGGSVFQPTHNLIWNLIHSSLPLLMTIFALKGDQGI